MDNALAARIQIKTQDTVRHVDQSCELWLNVSRMGSSVPSSLSKVRSRRPFLCSTASWACLTAVLCANSRASRAFTCCSDSFGMQKHNSTRHKHTRYKGTKTAREDRHKAGMAGEFGWLGWKKVKTHRKINNKKGVNISSLY
jgi:hypothetical protein